MSEVARQRVLNWNAKRVCFTAREFVEALGALNEVEEDIPAVKFNELKRLFNDAQVKFRVYETRFTKGGKDGDR